MRQPKSAHRKTQTPIVATQILYSTNTKHVTKTERACIFTYANICFVRAKKGYSSPTIEKHPYCNIEFV